MSQKRKAAANIFMEQNVMQEAEQAKAPLPALAAPAPGAPPQPQRRRVPPGEGLKTSEELQLEKEPIQVRETGFWIWRRIIVPPNAYVIHTRLGRKEPVTLGLGLSFRYNPFTDAYLVVPAAMQTIGVVANCISKEKQGLNILAYVQWQINDFSVAYRKLDFSDSRDPLGIVNAQLREQAEAAIKDKIATMSVEEVLTDKEPIIEELTTRLKAVSEGRPQNQLSGGDATTGEGLGIKIVTVQIKEALVSSQRLWEHLQAPFRYEQEKKARISQLLSQDEIRQKELENRQLAETSEAEALVVIERTKQTKQTEALDVRLTEEATRFTKEQESVRQKIQLEEQTTLTQRESEERLFSQEQEGVRQKIHLEEQTTLTQRESAERLKTQAANSEQIARLAALRRQQEEALERTQLDTEAKARQKTLQVEQTLQEIVEETRLAERQMQAEQERLERETALKQQEADYKLMVQEQEALLQGKILEAQLSREKEEHQTRLELEEAANRLKLAFMEKEVELGRLQQEIRNLMNQSDLASQFIARLPELAAQMPEIHELKVLQTGQGDGTFDGLAQFVTKMAALAESLGISLPAHKPNGE